MSRVDSAFSKAAVDMFEDESSSEMTLQLLRWFPLKQNSMGV